MPESVLQRVAAGDPLAVRECIEQYRGLVWSLVRRFQTNYADAEDWVQDIFIEIWRKAGRFDACVSSESTYISMIARRRLIDRYRKRIRQPGAATLETDPIAVSSNVESALETREQAERARQLLARLRPEEQNVLGLALEEGLSQREVAEATKLPLGTVKTHTRRGLMRLRKLLGVEQDDEGDGRSIRTS